MLYSVAEKILSVHRGAKFLKADLHIHTPASKDWNEKNPEPQFKSDKIQPEQIVDSAIDAGLDLIAITDHNSVEWCERVIQAASGKPLIVLPGFELTVNPGIHVLAIFEQNKDLQELRDLLTGLGIKTKDFGNANAQTDAAITNPENVVIRAIDNAGGLAIPAHIENGSGLIGRIRGGDAVRKFLQKSGCRILEVTHDKPHEIIADFLRNDQRRFALIRNSDAHRLDAIGARNTWVKLDPMLDRNQEPRYLDELKQIGFEPISRIQFSDDDPSKKAQIIGMYSDGGLLREQAICFNEELNCVIGGRGAGKSALLDYLRFVLGDEPDADELKQKLRKRYVNLIGNSTSVYVLVEDPSDDLWLYERKFEFVEEKNRGRPNTIEITSPRTTKHQVFPERMETIKFGDESELFSVDFYGQGEVQSITNQAETSRQLKLVDNFASVSINQREAQIAELSEALDDIEQQLHSIYTDYESLSSRIDNLDSLNSRIAEIEESLEKDIFQAHQIWADANHWISNATSHFDDQINSFSQISIDALEKQDFTIADEQALHTFNKLQTTICGGLDELAKQEKEFLDKGKQIKVVVDTLRKEWDKKFQTQKTQYTDQLRKQGVANLEVLNNELAQKRRERDDITTKDIPKRNEITDAIKKLEGNRKKLLKGIHESYASIRECRILASKEMTTRLRNEVKIEIIDEKDTTTFLDALTEVAPPNTQKKHLSLIANNISPQEFVKSVKRQDQNTLKSFGITEDGTQKIFSIDKEDLFKLERIHCDDIAVIQLKIDGAYRNLGELSEGEKCTAVLSIILLDENRPLVIDQPEDELDHDFIMSNVVNTLADVKQRSNHFDVKHQPRTGRQFIIATHNQNIPVLGNAELVIRMQKTKGEERCEVVTAYALEHPETIQQVLSLEGGKSAFERRRQKYSVH